jgi:CubicO group peptidase (beta-lactamase class C family)
MLHPFSTSKKEWFTRLLLFSFLLFGKTGLSEAKGKKSASPKNAMALLDARMQHFIKVGDFPGAVLIVRKGDKTLVRKAWGKLTYKGKEKPDPSKSVYDLASVTKAVAVATSMMHLYDEKKIDLEAPLTRYLKASQGFPLGELTLERLLSHKTGLPPYYFPNYWLLSKDLWKESNFSPVPTPQFPDPYRGKYLPKGFRQVMLRDMCQLPFHGKNKTIYSDLNYILLGSVIEEVTGKRLDEYLNDWLIRPMGLKSTCFNPLLNGIALERTVPTTENADLQGWVNDNEAAKLAGICGAAGLFSTGDELIQIADMLRAGGKWNGKRFLQASTIKRFAWKLEPGHVRSLGWQKPAANRRTKTIAPPKASLSAFGHTGYTGTLFWVDPQKDLSIVLLTNVTYPKDGLSHFKEKAGYKTVLRLVYDLL